MNLLDIIIILIIILGAIRGMRKGLVAVLGKLVSYLAAFVLAVFLYHSLSDYVNSKLSLTNKISLLLSKQFSIPKEASTISSFFIGDSAQKIGEGIFHQTADLIINAGAFIFIFMVVGNIFKFIADKSSAKLNVSFIGGINRLGGLIAGILSSLFSLTITFFLVAPIISIFNSSDYSILMSFNNLIKGSLIANWMINLATKILG